MCIIIDTCTFDTVFSQKNQGHTNFKPVLKWILKGAGKLVIGGRTYKKETIKQSESKAKLIGELSRKNKIIHLNDLRVDLIEKELKQKVTDKEFNDPHIVAMIIESSSKLVCSADKKAHRFFKMKELYNPRKPPTIYSSKKHSKYLCNKYIPEQYL